ncbi:MAG: relaxase/mobilization nuclease [Mongoliibacter sp.]|uniref:relaxase/mobilization nuclease domain-containing protein n=1 Tax=Mongoliibacter sp. TaxID=2022438 RepID=UPI0012EFF2F8|nr:relaxase/mobilization nuclease domain-containing protein [Mongoliibacter sp.]TVP54456.1 MAG: relaxase/mobilization nuclease [Mongoliibacter sp.]
MVAKITTGKSLHGLLVYNENKVKLGEAKVLSGNGFPSGFELSSVKTKLRRFEKLTDLNRRTKTNCVHISLNFSPKDKIDDELLKYTAKEYMKRIGFAVQPYLVYRHYDAGHPHIHIVTTNIDAGGKRIETHDLGKNQSEKARRLLEKELGLIKAEDQKKEYTIRTPLEKAEYGIAETKSLVSNIVTEVLRNYYFGSFSAFNAVLSQYKVEAVEAGKVTEEGKMPGLLYFILDNRGKRVSVPVKASSIHSRPTRRAVDRKIEAFKKAAYKPNKEMKQRISDALNACKNNERNLKQFGEELRKRAVYFKPAYTVDGKLFGTTYVDNISRTVFKGSEIGKEFTASGIQREFLGSQLNIFNKTDIDGSGKFGSFNLEYPYPEYHTQSNQDYLNPDLSKIISSRSLRIPEQEYAGPNPFKRRKKRKKKPNS